MVETFPKEKVGLLVAGVATLGWLDVVAPEFKPPKGLLPPFPPPPPPNRLGVCVCPEVEPSDGLAGVENPENGLDLVAVPAPNRFPLLEGLLSPNTDEDCPVVAVEPNNDGVGPEVLPILPKSPEDEVVGV